MRTKSEYDRFPIVKRGYEPAAVETHLTSVIDENDQTLDEAAVQIAALQTQLEEFQKHEEAVHLTILAATKTKEDMLEVAQRQADEARDAGRKQGDGIITDARMQAFQVVTEARKEAEGIVAEARSEAGALMRSVEANAPASDLPSEREIALEIRVEELQGVIAAMESELRSRPAVADASTAERDDDQAAEPPTTESTVIPIDFGATGEDGGDDTSTMDVDASAAEEDIEIDVTESTGSTSIDEHVTTDQPQDVEVVEPSLNADAPIDDGSITDDRDADAVRRSFYSRRSAKLPRIGVEAGRGAMAAAAGLRKGLPSDESTDESDPDRSQEYETV